MFCTRCGSANSDQAQFCGGCGSPLNALPAAPIAAGSAAAMPFASAPVFARPAPVRYAGFWRRFVALIIDGLVFAPLFLIIVAVALPIGALSETGGRDYEGLAAALFGVGMMVIGLGIFAGSWLYHTMMESSRYQATLGKMALGIIVTDLNGARISFARANGRFFGKWLSGMIMNIGYIMAAFTEKKQALHDILAGCLVIMK
ncbi:MAG: domain containing protein [Bryobacterales bacterium]|nr:domain containing protein [Bryobacterales bacterium]